LAEWNEADVWARLHQLLLTELHQSQPRGRH
jgi:hypothetical protein